MQRRYMLATLAIIGCGSPKHGQPVPVANPAAVPATGSIDGPFSTSTIALPGGGPDGVFMDYLLYDPRTSSVWVPAGNTGTVDVVDVATGRLSAVTGFPTQEMERRGRKRVVGPSSATLGAKGTVYIGNRGDFSICAIDELTLQKGTCGKLDAMPDGIAYVEKTQEVWVTTPSDKSIRVLDAATLVQKARLEFDGEPEGFAPDNSRGRFYTNLEDKDVTLAIDLTTHQTVATWKPNCGQEGPHGLRLAEADGFLLVACSSRLESLDVVHDGEQLGTTETGDGVDDIDFSATTRRVYVGAAKAATLTIAALDQHGALTRVTSVQTKEGARNGVVTADNRVYLSHSQGAELVVATPGGH